MNEDSLPHEPQTNRAPVVGRRVLWSWLGPGILGLALIACFLFGLVAASEAADDGTYAAGFVLAGAALIGLGCELRYGFAGALPSLLVETAEGLAVLVALLAALALFGLFVAARAEDPALHSLGYALCVVCVVLIALNLKHYCDVCDRAKK